MSERPSRDLENGQIGRHFRPGRLTTGQRRRHLEQLARAIAAEEEDMEFLKRRSLTELAVLAAAVLVVVLAVVTWNLLWNDGGSDRDAPDDLVAIAQATLTARAAQPDSSVAPSTGTAVPAATQESMASDGLCRSDGYADLTGVMLPVDPYFPDWYGSNEAGLWVAPLNRDILLHSAFASSGSRWFAGHLTFVRWYGALDPAHLTGELLDGDATIDVSEEPDAIVPIAGIQALSFEIPEPGCWKLTMTAGDRSLTITVDVLPFNQRPDVEFANQFHPARPYPVPASCPVTPWTGPESRFKHMLAQHWIDAGGITVGATGWLTADGEAPQTIDVYGDDVTGDFLATATNLDRHGSAPIVGETAQQTASSVQLRKVSFAFPEPGCWELELATESASATIVVYIYPAACVPTFEEGEVMVSCEQPT